MAIATGVRQLHHLPQCGAGVREGGVVGAAGGEGRVGGQRGEQGGRGRGSRGRRGGVAATPTTQQ